jgi:acyl transferase domain-containing protein/thioesterase domain-containing protein
MAGGGFHALPADEGLALFDAAGGVADAVLIPAKINIKTIRANATAGTVHPMLRGLVGEVRRVGSAVGVDAADALRQRLLGMPKADADRVVLDLVRTHAAGVLRHASADAIDPDLGFMDVGFDSLTVLELRNSLAVATGLKLPSTLMFDYPRPAVLAGHLRMLLSPPTMGVASVTAAQPQRVDGDPIVIVGMSCRFPGGVVSPEGLWRLLESGVDAVSDFPVDRGWDEDLYDPDPDQAGKSYAREGGFVRDVGDFDAAFFRISPREAVAMDPQQRLLLEAAWELFEGAGVGSDVLRGSSTGVFVGTSGSDYQGLLAFAQQNQDSSAEGHLGTGNSGSVVSGRIAYTFGLEGPAVTVDTACSSSLVALHLAAQSLRAGECSLAVAGGVTVMATPGTFIEFSRQRAMAADGRCKAFSEDADGTGWAEGAGLLLLERLSDARRNGHQVLALVRGSAVNQDGASSGLTVPNGPAQQRVIRAALANAGLVSADVDAVEAHGTGTTLGDPIEAHALLATYGQDRAEGHPLRLGSVKSNIGHTQTAAGAAGVIKMVLAMQHGLLPKTLHVGEPSTHVDWSMGSVQLLTESLAWPETGHPRRAGVSSFGISGTNAHIIIEQAPAEPAEDGNNTQDNSGLSRLSGLATADMVAWVLSGRTPGGLQSQAVALRAHVDQYPELLPVDVGLSLATMRTLFDHRGVVVGTDRAELLAGLDALIAGVPSAGVARGAARGVSGPKVAFVFPGEDSHVFPGEDSHVFPREDSQWSGMASWSGMALGLLDSSVVFAERIAECESALAPFVGWSLVNVLRGGSRTDEGAPDLDGVDVVQPVLWAVMVSLAAVWRSYGVVPDVVMGHAQGEIAAACVAGVLSLEDAAQVVALRSQALVELSGLLGTVSSDHASHLVQVEGVRDRLSELLVMVTPRVAEIEWLPTLAGQDPVAADGEYWCENLSRTVEWAPTIGVLSDRGCTAFVEVSLDLTGVQDCVDAVGSSAVVVGWLRPGEGGVGRLMMSLAELHVQGVSVDWRAVFAGSGGAVVELPTYAFQRQRYWLDVGSFGGSPASAGQRSLGQGSLGQGSAGHSPLDAAVLIQRLAGLPDVECDQVLLEIVLAQAAAALGHGSAEAVDPEGGFMDAGFDSLTALDLRNRLTVATGLTLPPALVFDHATPADLATHLRSELALVVLQGAPVDPHQAPSRVSAEMDVSDSIIGLFRTACATDRVGQGFELLRSAASFRPHFGSAAEYGERRAPVRAASGDAEFTLICFSSYAALGGVHQHARFAAEFRGLCDVWVLPTPGFVQGEPLPRTWQAVAEMLSEVVQQCAAGNPVILLGQSSGGVLAQAAASCLEDSGVPVEAIVLLDTYELEDLRDSEVSTPSGVAQGPHVSVGDMMLQGMLDREDTFVAMDFARLTAMAWYFRIFDGWKASRLLSPILLVRASEPMVLADSDEPAGLEWQATSEFAHTVIDVPGNHFTMMEEHAGATGQVVRDWIRTTRFPAASSGNG